MCAFVLHFAVVLKGVIPFHVTVQAGRYYVMRIALSLFNISKEPRIWHPQAITTLVLIFYTVPLLKQLAETLSYTAWHCIQCYILWILVNELLASISWRLARICCAIEWTANQVNTLNFLDMNSCTEKALVEILLILPVIKYVSNVFFCVIVCNFYALLSSSVLCICVQSNKCVSFSFHSILFSLFLYAIALETRTQQISVLYSRTFYLRPYLVTKLYLLSTDIQEYCNVFGVVPKFQNFMEQLGFLIHHHGLSATVINHYRLGQGCQTVADFSAGSCVLVREKFRESGYFNEL